MKPFCEKALPKTDRHVIDLERVKWKRFLPILVAIVVLGSVLWLGEIATDFGEAGFQAYQDKTNLEIAHHGLNTCLIITDDFDVCWAEFMEESLAEAQKNSDERWEKWGY